MPATRIYDRVLVVLVLVAPLVMLSLSKWRASLDNWYQSPDVNPSEYFPEDFEAHLGAWLQQTGEPQPSLVLIADRRCPCTTPALTQLQAAVADSDHPDVGLRVQYVDAPRNLPDPHLDAVLASIPATPTLLVWADQRLRYAGPVSAGSYCTTAVSQVLGLSSLSRPPSQPLFGGLARGCYCPLGKATL